MFGMWKMGGVILFKISNKNMETFVRVIAGEEYY